MTVVAINRKHETKPRISRCGNHWTVEWNRWGDWFPMHKCVPTWEDAMHEAAIVIAQGRHA